MPRRDLMRLLHLKGSDFDQIVSTLVEQGDIERVNIATKIKPALGYALT